jgi:ABC-type uncharacterized transport system auxiliary subunit
MTAIVLFSGCITVNVPIGGDTQSTATVWNVEPDRVDPWIGHLDKVIQIKDFTCAQAASGVQMIVRDQDGTMNKSSTDVWSSRPIEMLPDILCRDMVDGGAYGAVLRSSTMLPEDMIVEGYIREFGGRSTGSTWEAVLDVDVTVLDGHTYDLIFQENYRFNWQLDSPSYAQMASAMNTLVGFWSEEVMNDIWSTTLPIR